MGLSGCSDRDEGATDRPLSSDEAAQLANIQYTNFQAKGATFELNTAFNQTGDRLSMRGEVDWVNHAGYARVLATGSEVLVTDVIWRSDVIFERRPTLDGLIAAMGSPDAKFIQRPVDIRGRQVDRAISILIGLASTQPDNAVLIQQKADSSFMRMDSLRGKKVEVLRFSQNARYWVEQGTSVLRRFDANNVSGVAPIVIDFISFGEQNILMPNERYVISYEDVQDVYNGASK